MFAWNFFVFLKVQNLQQIKIFAAYLHSLTLGTNVIRSIFLFEQEEISHFIYLNSKLKVQKYTHKQHSSTFWNFYNCHYAQMTYTMAILPLLT